MKLESLTALAPESRPYRDKLSIAHDYITCSPRIKPNGMIGELELPDQLYTQTKKRKADGNA